MGIETMLNWLVSKLKDSPAQIESPLTVARADHSISRAQISEHALKVLYRLRTSGHEAFLVGGGVRDLLLGREPKDFDVVTDAKPEQLKGIFRNCRLIGRRFRLAHVHFGRDYVEVATFRATSDGQGEERMIENGRILRDNVYGTIEEDAWRRDFTVNALYYNIRDFAVVDYTGGMQDLNDGVLRLIGEPEQRYREDPVRMLRAVRFAVKLGFNIDPDCETPLRDFGHLLQDIAPARLFEEVLKLFLGGSALQTFEALRHYGLFGQLFPETDRSLEAEEEGFPIVFVARAMQNTDARIAAGKPVTPAFLFASLLWEPVRSLASRYAASDMSATQALQVAGDEVVGRQARHVSIPRRYSQPMREVWALQPRFEQRAGKRALRFLSHPRFRAAYDFMLLRCASGEADEALGVWWTQLQEMNETDQAVATSAADRPPRRRRRRRRSGGGGASETAPET
jgi:poly(A) polymerase